MKIRGTCKRDDRDFMVEQVIASGGECPWDGEPFNADYAATLVDALQRAEAAGTELEMALQVVADLHPEFRLHVDSVIAPLREHLERLDVPMVAAGLGARWTTARTGTASRIGEAPDGWRVAIEDPAGVVVMERACADGSEARTFASTVRQHIYWLSPDTFRAYYRI